jgi:pyruvate formate lyase activating enzyme
LSEREALFYERIDNDKVQCLLCPHNCKLNEGRTGLCRVRTNRKGGLVTSNYGEVSSLALDPIEKKPLFHFFPGQKILSAGTFGCNLACSFCQNYSIAQETPHTEFMEPEAVADLALKVRGQGSIGVAFTYNEPSIWYEYILDTARLLQAEKLKTVLVTNGYMADEPLQGLLTYIDAVNIDVKAFTEDFYRTMCKGSLKPVKAAVEALAGQVHIEVTTLVIPGLNDNEREIQELSQWLAALDPHIVLHLSRYHPTYKLDLPPTPAATIKRAQEKAREYLHFVYTGNLPGEENNTLCLNCGCTLIRRNVYRIDSSGIKNGRCSCCNTRIQYIVSS